PVFTDHLPQSIPNNPSITTFNSLNRQHLLPSAPTVIYLYWGRLSRLRLPPSTPSIVYIYHCPSTVMRLLVLVLMIAVLAAAVPWYRFRTGGRSRQLSRPSHNWNFARSLVSKRQYYDRSVESFEDDSNESLEYRRRWMFG
ncbi:hypothetical protein OTU49_013039, partial [Cherax quadricarinatus]